MNCKFLWIDEDGFTHCDCYHSRAGGQINDRGDCDPYICKLTKKEREKRK